MTLDTGSFAEERCAGYDPPEETEAESGKMISIEEFETQKPYENHERFTKRFACPGNETVHIRLDPTRGFQTESCCDSLRSGALL